MCSRTSKFAWEAIFLPTILKYYDNLRQVGSQAVFYLFSDFGLSSHLVLVLGLEDFQKFRSSPHSLANQFWQGLCFSTGSLYSGLLLPSLCPGLSPPLAQRLKPDRLKSCGVLSFSELA